MYLRILAALLFLAPALRAQDGMYADFATSMGNFTVKLHFDKTPRTVANFIALATGSRAWMDIPTGDAKRKPYYNGLIFHRVVAGFVIQGGSPNGNGTDGPGYTFKDEFDPTLRHDKAGILSMANSGLHSNGSQFFITLAATSHLDDVHSVFGEVTSGLAVVQAIGVVPVNGSSKPLTPVVMNSVTIRRVGPAAQVFNEHAQGLPSVGGAGAVLVQTGSNFALRFTRALNNEYWIYYGPTLSTTSKARFGIYTATAPTGDIASPGVTTGQNKYFYRVPQIAYPGTLYTPEGIAGSTITMNTTGGTIQYIFNAAGTAATCSYNGGTPGNVTSANWIQEAYRGRFSASQPTVIIPISADLAFSSPGGGTLKGTASTGGAGSPFTGTFTFTRP